MRVVRRGTNWRIGQKVAKKVDKWLFYNKILVVVYAEVAELADALRSGRSGQYAREGSNPSFGTNPAMSGIFV